MRTDLWVFTCGNLLVSLLLGWFSMQCRFNLCGLIFPWKNFCLFVCLWWFSMQGSSEPVRTDLSLENTRVAPAAPLLLAATNIKVTNLPIFCCCWGSKFFKRPEALICLKIYNLQCPVASIPESSSSNQGELKLAKSKQTIVTKNYNVVVHAWRNMMLGFGYF